MVLLLAALSAKVDSPRLQRSLLGVAAAIFAVVALVIGTFPVEI
jgi:hypothetical protein